MKIAVIKTKHFILRPFRKGDEFSLQKNINNRKIYRNTSHIPYPYTLRHAKNWIRKKAALAKKKKPESIVFAIDKNNEVIGSIGIHHIKGHKGEVGYWLGEKYWGRGIMTEAVNRITKFGFEKQKLKRMYARTFHFNKASMKVLKKAGFKLEGILRKNVKKGNRFLDTHLFAKVK